MAKCSALNNMESLKNTMNKSINIIGICIIPVTFIFMVFSEPIIKTMFGRGAFDYAAIVMSSSALFFYSIGMLGMGLREVTARAFYSLQDTKTPTINASIGVVIMGIVQYELYGYFINRYEISVSLILSVCIGGIVYLLALYFMKIEEIRNLVSVLKRFYDGAF